MHLTRNRQERCVAARVRRAGRLHRKYFTLKAHGSWRTAEQAARGWLRALLPTLPALVSSKGRRTRRNHSGVVGVYRSPGLVRKPDGRAYACPRWIARWPGCPLAGGVSWSVGQCGEDEAFALAVLARRQESANRDALLDALAELSPAEFAAIVALKRS